MTPAHTGKGNTPGRTMRVPADVWQAALDKARAEGTTLSAVVVDFLRSYTEKATRN